MAHGHAKDTSGLSSLGHWFTSWPES